MARTSMKRFGMTNESGFSLIEVIAAMAAGLVVLGAALQAPGYGEAICFAVDRPQTARFQEASIRISLGPGEPLWFGLATPDQFDKWTQSRRKK